MKKGFTLLELIVVIIIIGILATLGYTQYGKVMEYGRQVEARAILGLIIKNALSYRLVNGTTTGMQNSDVGIGSSAGQIPSSCVSTHYYWYNIDYNGDPALHIVACRCIGGGKNPQGTSGGGQGIWIDVNLQTGNQAWQSNPTSCGS